ncbi:MAG: hypothetical protein IKQ75_09505 [Bacteroidales bacterium]|nr:hypothetical protein [Bacteroidales bacterium]MCR4738494.1 hypothetical protein [Bacteroidales bacterium]
MKRTIKLFSMMILAIGILMAGPASAQTDKQQKKEKKEYQKEQNELRKALYKKDEKLAYKTAKKLERQGWKTMSLPIAKQLDRTWMKEMEEETPGIPRYIAGRVEATGNTYTAAQSMADNVAKLRIASQVSSSVASYVEMELVNNQTSTTEATSISKTIENAKGIVSEKLGRTFKTLEIYQLLSNGNYKVRVVMFYDLKAAVSIAREVMLEELKKESDINKAKLEKLLGMDKIMEQVAKDLSQYDEIAE